MPGVVGRPHIQTSWDKVTSSSWDRQLALACRRADMLLCPSTLEYIFIVCNLQILKAFNIIGDFLGPPFDDPAPDNAVLGADEVLSSTPDIAQEHSNAHARVRFVLVALVGLADEPDSLAKPKHKMTTFASSDPLIGCYAVDSNFVLVERVSHIRNEPGEEQTLHIHLLPESGLDVVLDRPQLFLPQLHRVLHHPVRLGCSDR